MRADRLLSIVLLLQRHHHLTASTLAENLGVTERTIYRDIEALSIAGVPVYTRTGPEGGCFLDEAYRTSLNWFTGAELQALLFTGSASPLSELGMQHAMDNAVLKLLALLPNRYQQEAEQMRQRLYLDPSGWYDNGENHPALPILKEAVWGDQWVAIDYETWDGQPQSRQLAPYSLVYKSGRWYLVGESHTSHTMRTYRISRIKDVQLLTTQFERDPHFNIADYWADSAEQFQQRLPSYPVKLRVHPRVMIYFQHMYGGRYDILEQHTDYLVLDVQYTVFEEARTSVLGLGVDAEVIEPRELHMAVIEQAQAIVSRAEHSQ